MTMIAILVQSCSNTEKPVQPAIQNSNDQSAQIHVDSSQVLYRDTLAVIIDEMLAENGKGPQESTALYFLSEWRNSFSQGMRNQLIFERAMAENGWATSYNCKTWAQHIVSAASGCITLPSTCPNAYGYYFCSSSNVRLRLQNQSANYPAFVRGNVMQMWYGGANRPHTAIIYWSDAGGITFVDCNFVGAGRVGVHWMSWSTFYSRVPAYTLYEVI
jgi:hypothetical protein